MHIQIQAYLSVRVFECAILHVYFSVQKKIYLYLRVRVFQCTENKNTCVFESACLSVFTKKYMCI